MAAMTKKNFFWCLNKCDGIGHLDSELLGDGWTSCFSIAIKCYARHVPNVDMNNNGVRSLSRIMPAFYVVVFNGVSSLHNEKNQKCQDRASKAMDKYNKWLKEWRNEQGN